MQRTAKFFLPCLLILVQSCVKDVSHPKKNVPFRLGLYTNGVHLSYLLPVKSCVNWEAYLDMKPFSSVEVDYILFGWGDLNFYQNTPSWKEFSFLAGIEALFYSRGSVVHVTAMKDKPLGENYIELGLSFDECKTITSHIKHSFKANAELIQPTQKGYGKLDYFYDSSLHYSFLNTCNNWIADGLASAHLETAIWNGVSGPLFEVAKNSKRRIE